MDRASYIQKRRKKYLAQVLEDFERAIGPSLPATATDDVENFKGLVRRKMNALAVDAIDVIELDGHINGYAIETRDRLHPEGRPSQRTQELGNT